MTTTLVSFLGRVPRKPNDSSGGNYQRARYRFPDGADVETPFFGLALFHRLTPDRVVLLGTRGSMWDVLIDHLTQDPTHDDVRLALLAAAETSQVTADLVRQAQPVIESAIGRPCSIQLIDYGRDQPEQLAILEAIAEAVPKGRVTHDLTHGFRHLAAPGLLSAFFLEPVARLTLDGLYYGANDMREGGAVTPVIRLDGLLTVQRWIDALERFGQTGDYAAFAPLLEAAGVPADKTRNLKRAAYFERTLNLNDAYSEILAFQAVLERPLDGASGLFNPSCGAASPGWRRATLPATRPVSPGFTSTMRTTCARRFLPSRRPSLVNVPVTNSTR